MATSVQLKSFQLFQVCRTHRCFQGSLWAQAIVSFYQASPRSIPSYLLCSLPRRKPSRLQTCYCWSSVHEKKLYKNRRVVSVLLWPHCSVRVAILRGRRCGVYMYMMEYYSDIKRNGIMPFAATWMELEIIILSEVNQKEKDKYHMLPLIRRI